MRATQLGVMVFTRQFHWAKAPGICIRPNRGKANAPHIARIIAPVAVRGETSSKPIKATHMQQEQPRPAQNNKKTNTVIIQGPFWGLRPGDLEH